MLGLMLGLIFACGFIVKNFAGKRFIAIFAVRREDVPVIAIYCARDIFFVAAGGGALHWLRAEKSKGCQSAAFDD